MQVDVVKYFLQRKAIQVNARTSEGNTAFHIAAQTDFLPVVKLFLTNSRVDLNAQNSKGQTALHLAVKRGCLETVSAILHTPEINPDIVTESGRTAFRMAEDSKNEEMIKLFETYFHVRNEKGCSVA